MEQSNEMNGEAVVEWRRTDETATKMSEDNSTGMKTTTDDNRNSVDYFDEAPNSSMDIEASVCVNKEDDQEYKQCEAAKTSSDPPNGEPSTATVPVPTYSNLLETLKTTSATARDTQKQLFENEIALADLVTQSSGVFSPKINAILHRAKEVLGEKLTMDNMHITRQEVESQIAAVYEEILNRNPDNCYDSQKSGDMEGIY